MNDTNILDRASAALARRALFITLSLAVAGAGIGIIGALVGMVVGKELILVVSSLIFSSAALITLCCFRAVALQTVATVSTSCFAINLCVGVLISVLGSGEHLNLFVYLIWFFPLLVFNNLVNQPSVGRSLAKILLIAPVLLISCLIPRLIVVLTAQQRILLGVFCVSYCCYAATLNLVARYREQFIVERERGESLKVEADILESISDCFISLDSDLRLVYLNDAACSEFAFDRRVALNDTLSHASPGFLSKFMMTGLPAASIGSASNIYEVHNEERGRWYDVRCFPRPDGGISIYFRNITDHIVSRQKLLQANTRLREQAELLDKAQDAILVMDMDFRVRYWNRGAERLYGWTSEETVGRPAEDIFLQGLSDINRDVVSLLRDGEWAGEMSQLRRDGSALTVESRYTIVRGEDGKPRSILAINTDITSRRAGEARIERLAFFDVLTGLPNRQLMRDRLNSMLLSGKPGALLYIELDDLKRLNNTMGHDIGDALLQQIAARISSCVRPGDTVARVGSDEFVVILVDLGEDALTAADVVQSAGDRMLETFHQPFTVGSYECETTASIGATLFSGLGDSVDLLLKRSGLAMHHAKAQGQKTVCFFDQGMQSDVESRAALRSDLRRALQKNEFKLHYQPQVNIHGVVAGAEALLRWHHPMRGNIAPNVFIPLAEEAGFIVELGRWALETACFQLAKWTSHAELKKLTLAVNVSLRQFIDPWFLTLLRDALRISGANPHLLRLEFTESCVMENAEEMIAKMSEIKLLGIGFSLDDFGTGYSSLSHLKLLPLDELKIDRSFINDMLTNIKGASIARTIISLGHNLDLSVIAEGVETLAQRDFLMSEGCDLYQGFLYSPAVTAIELSAYVETAGGTKSRSWHIA